MKEKKTQDEQVRAKELNGVEMPRGRKSAAELEARSKELTAMFHKMHEDYLQRTKIFYSPSSACNHGKTPSSPRAGGT